MQMTRAERILAHKYVWYKCLLFIVGLCLWATRKYFKHHKPLKYLFGGISMLFPVMYEIIHYAFLMSLAYIPFSTTPLSNFRQGKLYKPQIRTCLYFTRTFSSQPFILQTGPKSETLLRELASFSPPFPPFSCQLKDFLFFHQDFTADIYSLKKLYCHWQYTSVFSVCLANSYLPL